MHIHRNEYALQYGYAHIPPKSSEDPISPPSNIASPKTYPHPLNHPYRPGTQRV
ncbi:hypothetical protein BGX38DRAFT_1220878, partial [Terfezia claveryi]